MLLICFQPELKNIILLESPFRKKKWEPPLDSPLSYSMEPVPAGERTKDLKPIQQRFIAFLSKEEKKSHIKKNPWVVI